VRPSLDIRFDWPAAAGYGLDVAGAGADETDTELIRRVAAGDRAAVGLLYDRYAALLLAVAQRIVGDPREAEDLLHDVILEIWRAAGDHDEARGSVRSWILMRMRSRSLDRRRAPRVARQVALTPQVVDETPALDDPQLAPDRARVRKALAALPPEQRAVLELGYYEGLSSTEIAERLAAPVGTVKSRVAAGLSKLRAGLDLRAPGEGA
jgi:RNA polymerase sigma-70 factor (ECF subfamily)